MKIHVRSRGFELTDALRAHAERRLLFALGRFGTRVRSVTLRPGDVNGPRGGADKRCHVLARLVPWGVSGWRSWMEISTGPSTEPRTA